MPLPRDPLSKQAGVNFTVQIPFSFLKILLMEVLNMLSCVPSTLKYRNDVEVLYLLVSILIVSKFRGLLVSRKKTFIFH